MSDALHVRLRQPVKTCPNPECNGDGSALMLTRDELNTRKWYGWVACDWCGMRGPIGTGEEQAIEYWNGLPR